MIRSTWEGMFWAAWRRQLWKERLEVNSVVGKTIELNSIVSQGIDDDSGTQTEQFHFEAQNGEDKKKDWRERRKEALSIGKKGEERLLFNGHSFSLEWRKVLETEGSDRCITVSVHSMPLSRTLKNG